MQRAARNAARETLARVIARNVEKTSGAWYTALMKIILSNTAHDAYHRVLGELKRRLPDGGEHVVIVPDKFTASSERGVIETLGVSSVFNVSVTSFTRLAEKTIGSRIKKCLTPQGSVLLLAKVIEENRGNLRFYARAARATGFAEEFYAALTAVRNSGITPAELREAAKRAPENFRGKLEDMSLIYDAYIAALGERHSDSSTRLEAFAEYLNGAGPIPTHFYVVDFYDFKAPELAVLGGLAKNALSLTVGMVSGFDNPNKRIYCDGAAARLAAACGGADVERSTERLHPAAETISRRLFSYELPPERTENDGKVRIVAARTRAEEIKWLVTDIVRKVAAGARYKDFEVVLSDVEGYKAELKSTFLRYGVPFFIDTREMLSEQTKPRLLLSALSAARSGLHLPEVLEFVKNPLFSCGTENGEDDVFRFENYCRKYRRDRSGLLSPFTVGSEEEIACAERVRSRLAEALRPLLFKGNISTEEFAERTRAFLDGFETEWRMHVAKLTESSLYYAKCADQVDEKIKSLLEEMSGTLESGGDAAYFERMLKSALKTVKIALVPTWLDCVYVGGTDNRYLGGGDIYVLGANVGKLPAGADGGAVLSPRDEELLSALDIGVSPNSRQRMFSEMMSVTEIMKRAKGTLTVSYPESDPSGELRPSTVISELRGMLGEHGAPLSVQRISFSDIGGVPPEERAAVVASVYSTPQACAYEVIRGLSSGADAETLSAAAEFMTDEAKGRLDRMYRRLTPPERLSGEAAESAAETARGRTSASRLESYFSCPYKQYFSYILRLKEREEARPEGKDYGIVLHAVLEKFFAAVMRGEVTAEKAEEIAGTLFDECVRENASLSAAAEEPATARALERLRREARTVCRVLFDAEERSAYKPVYVEGYIGGRDIPAPKVSARGAEAELRGRIDRVDACGDKFFITDYKTYRSADLSLADVYSGRKIQLYLYMQAIAESRGMTPVGVFYLPLSFDFTKDGAEWRYRGNMTCDETEAAKMDPLFAECPEKSVFPCVRDKKTGELAPPVHLTAEEFRGIGEYVRALAGEGVAEMTEGRIAPDPLEKTCANCNYVSVCAWQQGDKGRKCPAVKAADFAEDVGRPRAKLQTSAQEEEVEE